MAHKIAVLLLKVARWLSPEAWEQSVSGAASGASVAVTMTFLDRMGYTHCSECAQTQGLFNIAGRAYCHRHMPKMDATVWAIN